MIEEIINIIHTENSVLILLAGLTIGMLHAFEPDHITAVTTQTIKQKEKNSKSIKYFLRKSATKSSLMGAFWGAGHTSSILAIGLLVAGLSLTIPSSFFIGFELIVGLMLIFLGALVLLNRSLLNRRHLHPHKHTDGTIHTHTHDHDIEHKHGHKSYIIGCIHGLAGSGGLIALLASGLSSFEMIFYFLAVFGIGSIVGMTLISGIIGIPFALSSKMRSMHRLLRYAIASITIIIGINIIFKIAFAGSFLLFQNG